MAYDIRIMKLVSGDIVIGKYDTEKDSLNDVAVIQTMPTQQGVQMLILPYGYPFEPQFCGSIEGKHFMYRYAEIPDDLEKKYLEAVTQLTVSGGMGKLQFGPMGGAGGSGLIK
ncbi:MAG: hypothetical protein PHN64_05415 [Desulfovibrionaceae bacterium]|nr:hypothetical protein [Desulfovibrionaceae bacterium]